MKRVFSSLLCGWKVVLILSTAVLLVTTPSRALPVSPETARVQVNIGITPIMNNAWGEPILRETVRRLESELPGYRFKIVPLAKPELQKAVYTNKVDYFIASSGFYLHSNAIGGTSYVATLRGQQTNDAAAGMGAVYVTRADTPGVSSLEDLWSQRVAVVGPSNFYAWMILRSEISHLTRYPDSWFGKVIFTGDDDVEAFDLMMDGRADVAVMPTCQLEAILEARHLDLGVLRIVNEKHVEGYRCKLSTPLYTGSVFGAASNADPSLTRRIAGVLFTNDFSPWKFGWEVSNDFRDERFILEHFGLAPFVSNSAEETKSQKRLREALVIGSILLILAAAYGLILNRTIKKRTQALEAANEEKNHLERSGVVSGLSALIAHEIRQPLTSMTSYAEGLQLYLKDNPDEIVTEATTEIRREARRISDIVDRVRAYAKKQSRPHVKSNLAELIGKARATVINTSHSSIPIELTLATNAFVFCEPLEMELLFTNLMNNAVQACEGVTQAKVRVKMIETLENWIVTVSDNGPSVSDDIFEKLARPMSSQKIEGLGLGLTICRAIVIKHEGHLSFERVQPEGLCAKVTLPKPAQGIPGDPTISEIHLD